ncbi:MAG: hypothetical protein ABS81_02705 [Pseudonocardia sp. SCN 72-86]|nr:MAG: hypothetical protein ABS81_02705 [Pseudonocardia sp. SCN 72-86]
MAEHEGASAWGRAVTTEDVRGLSSPVYRDRRKRVAEMLLDARRWADRVHVTQESGRLTFREHELAAIRTAQWLREMGVGAGDRVLLLAGNRTELGVAFWAVQCLGAVVVLGNAWWSAEEVQAAAELVEPTVVIHDETTADRLPSGYPATPINAITPHLAGTEAPELELPAIAEDDPALVLFTSGTTGKAKGVLLTQRSVVNNMQNLLLATNRLPSELPTDHAGTVSLMTVPLFHLSGVHVLLSALLTGGRLVHQVGRFDAAAVLRLVAQERVRTWGCVPAMVVRVMEHPDFATTDLSSLRSIGLGGSAASPQFLERVRVAFPSLSSGGAGSLYGLTESGGLLAMGTGDELAGRPGSVGRLLPVARIRIADPDEDGSGEILARNPGMMIGYLGDVEQPIDKDGWLHTGDVGRLGNDGHLYLTGRSKEIIIRGGEKIACARVEEVLLSHSAVAEVAAVPLPDEKLGEEVGAVVVLSRGAEVTAAELKEYARSTLAYFELPARWWIRRALLPTSAQGKVARAEVLQSWTARGGGDIDDLGAVPPETAQAS